MMMLSLIVKKIIKNPGLLPDFDATYVSGALYGKP